MKKSTLRRIKKSYDETTSGKKNLDVAFSAMSKFASKPESREALNELMLSVESIIIASKRNSVKVMASESKEVIDGRKETLKAAIEEKHKLKRPILNADINENEGVISLYFVGGHKNKVRFFSLVAVVKLLAKAISSKDKKYNKWYTKISKVADEDCMKAISILRKTTKQKGNSYDE